MKGETDRRSWNTVAQQPRPSGEVGKIEHRIGTAETDLFGEDRCVLRAGAAGDDRSDIAENGVAQSVGELVEILVPDRQGERVFARLAEDERKAVGGEGLELVGIEVKGPTLG